LSFSFSFFFRFSWYILRFLSFIIHCS
jgi:hypothetical protein